MMGVPTTTFLQNSPLRPAVLYVKLVMTAIIWGGTFVAGRVLAQEVGPFSAAFLRFVVASTFLYGFVLQSHGKFPPLKRNQILLAVLLGLTGIFSYNYCFFSGLQTVTASRASLIIATNPVFIALFAAVWFREKLTLYKILGIVLSVSGALIVISHGHPLQLLHGGVGRGEGYMFGCVCSWVAYSLLGKVAMRELSPLVSVTYACALGAAFLSLPAFYEGVAQNLSHYSIAAWSSIGYLGLFGSAIGFIWYYEGIKAIGPARA
jgi:drug/metabolite transporter (DMT)-like permease